MATRSMDDWLDAYGESHQNPTNKKVHFVCVPVIFFTIVGFLWAIPAPLFTGFWACLALVFVTAYYARLSKPIALGMLVFSLCTRLDRPVLGPQGRRQETLVL